VFSLPQGQCCTGRDEIVETITHLAFYSGWPTANSAATIAKRVFEEVRA
jgi:4-carboxymuconolactone decarboxylase